jgi:class 3 adenylate cyclase
MSDNGTFLAQLEPIFEGMRKAESLNCDHRPRVAAILAADVVGSRRVGEEGEDGQPH